MERSAITDVLMRHHAAFAAHDAAMLAGQHAPDGVFESPAAGRVQGRPAIEHVYRYWFEAYPDMTFTWDAPIVEGDQAALFWSFAGTIRGPFFGVTVPGTHIEMQGAARYIFREDGLIALAQHLFDFSAVLMKAGVLKARPV
jgi:predicted ester cyclase